jgi:hypothetical protein
LEFLLVVILRFAQDDGKRLRSARTEVRRARSVEYAQVHVARGWRPRPFEHLIVTRQPALESFLVVILSETKDLRGAIPVCRRLAQNDLPKRHQSIKHAQGRVAGGFSLFP